MLTDREIGERVERERQAGRETDKSIDTRTGRLSKSGEVERQRQTRKREETDRRIERQGPSSFTEKKCHQSLSVETPTMLTRGTLSCEREPVLRAAGLAPQDRRSRA